MYDNVCQEDISSDIQPLGAIFRDTYGLYDCLGRIKLACMIESKSRVTYAIGMEG